MPMCGYFCNVWAGTPSCHLELLGKLQKQIYRTGPSFVASHEPLAHCQNLASFKSCIGIPLVDVLQNCLNWFHFLFFRGRPTHYSDRLYDFSVTIPRCYKDVYVNSFFPRLWDSLPIEWFPLTHNLSSFKSRINRHLLTLGSFQRDFLYASESQLKKIKPVIK